ncbi:MAG: tetratricopeptide repeat protein [Bacteroidota bacterium]
MTRFYILLSISISLFPIFKVFGQSAERQFQVGNQSYEIKEYAVAIEQYESIVSSGKVSAELFYNLGNAYYRSGELAKAILNYERAFQLSPEDEDILHNLSVARAEVRPELDQLPEFFLSSLWKDIQSGFSANAWAGVFLIFLWLGVACLILWQLGKQRSIRKWGFVAGMSLLSLGILGFLFANQGYQQQLHSNQAIVLEEKIKLRKGATAESEEMLMLYEGTKVKLLNNVIQDWYKVRLSNGQEGWLPLGAFEEI